MPVLSLHWRRTIDRAAETLLISSGIVGAAARASDRSIAVLAFHNVVPDGELSAGDRSLHMGRDNFAALIETLRRRAAIISLEEAIAALPRRRAALRIALTFDDAYDGAVGLGLDVLDSFDAPSTIFVAPGMLGDSSTWWDEAASQTAGVIPAEIRDEWLDGSRAGRAECIRPALGSVDEIPLTLRIAEADRLLASARRSRVTLASHTWSHPNLAALADNPASAIELGRELSAPLEWLRQSGAPYLPVLAYPYGRWSDKAVRAVASQGYSAAFRVDGGAWGSDFVPRHALPRINVPAAMRTHGVLARIAGWRR